MCLLLKIDFYKSQEKQYKEEKKLKVKQLFRE